MDGDINRIQYSNFDTPEEAYTSTENPRFQEMQQARETQTYDEFGSYSDTPGKAKEKERKRHIASSSAHIASAAVVVAAVAVLAVVPMSIFQPLFEPFGGLFDDGIDADSGIGAELYVDATDTTVYYEVTLDGWTEGECTVTVENKFTDRQQIFASDSFSYREEGLREGMGYTVTVTYAGEVLASATVTTDREAPEAYFSLDSAVCTCIEDDCFHFTIYAEGESRTGYRAVLTDLFGNSSEITISDTNAPQSIPVRTAGLVGDTATLEILCMEDGREVTLYRGEFEI